MTNLSNKLLRVLGILAIAITPFVSSAHVRWFTDEGAETISIPNEPVLLYGAVWFVILAIIVFIGMRLDRFLRRALWGKRHWSEKAEEYVSSVFGILVGSFFVIAAYNNFLFSSNLDHLGNLQPVFIALEGLIGLSFIVGFGIRLAAIVLLALWGFAFFYVGSLELLENVWVVGAALFAIIYGRSHFRIKNFLADRYLSVELR